MTITKAKNLILAQVEPDNHAGEPQTFLGGLRPYRGILPRQRFHDIMGALRILGPSLGTTTLVDRELISALWMLCELTRLWALEEGSMLRRNALLSEEDLALLKRWHGIISYAVMILLDTGDVASAFHEYDRYRMEEAD